MGQPTYLKKMTSIQGKDCLSHKNLVLDAPISLLSHRSDCANHKNLLKLNKLFTRPLKLYPLRFLLILSNILKKT